IDDPWGIPLTGNIGSDDLPVVKDAVLSQVYVPPEVLDARLLTSPEIEEDALGACAGQAGMNAVRQILQQLTSTSLQERPQLLRERIASCQLDELFFLFDDRAILVPYPAKSIEVLRMNGLSQDARVMEARPVNTADLGVQALDQTKEPL